MKDRSFNTWHYLNMISIQLNPKLNKWWERSCDIRLFRWKQKVYNLSVICENFIIFQMSEGPDWMHTYYLLYWFENWIMWWNNLQFTFQFFTSPSLTVFRSYLNTCLMPKLPCLLKRKPHTWKVQVWYLDWLSHCHTKI